MAGSSSSIHFRGRENVLQAYRDRSVEMWSIWQGRQFLTKGEDEQSLAAFMDILLNSGSQAVYTIRVYEDVTDLKKLKSTTADDGSFNFRLREPDGGAGGFSTGQGWQDMSARLDRMDAQWTDFLERFANDQEPEKDQEPESIGSVLTGLLSDPDKLEKIIKVGKTLLGIPDQERPAFVGNVNRLGSSPAVPAAPADQEARVQRLGVAIDTLERCDPQLVEHLEKLAAMAANKPAQFTTLIGMLDVY